VQHDKIYTITEYQTKINNAYISLEIITSVEEGQTHKSLCIMTARQHSTREHLWQGWLRTLKSATLITHWDFH